MSTTLAINTLTDMLISGFENSEFVYTQFLDLSKAFDCVSHDILINKLSYYKFSINSRKLLTSYLQDRSQFVNYCNINSKPINVKYGVPQGSVLGPTLFLVFINDLPYNTAPARSVLFADDTTLIFNNKDTDALISSVHNKQATIHDWFLANKLMLNDNKTESMIFSLRQHTLDTMITTNCVKFLGVHIDSKLTWENHVQAICGKMSKNIYLLRNLASCVSQKTLLTAYFGLIHSVLIYAILVWGHSPHAASAFAVQRKAVRSNCGLEI